MNFNLLHTNLLSRCARLSFSCDCADTPTFMPVGIYGTVKVKTPEEVEFIEAHIVPHNNFHLLMRFDTKLSKAHSGLHGFMHWLKTTFTNSGGSQVFSLAEFRKSIVQGDLDAYVTEFCVQSGGKQAAMEQKPHVG